MSHVFGIFQIGPVQEFINCAKKTQDFWSGSYLMSYLSCVAMQEVVNRSGGDNGVIIYPDLTRQPLYEYVAKLAQNGKKPWECHPQNDELRPTVPNRFVAKLDAACAKGCLDAAKDKVTTAFRDVAVRVQDVLWKKINAGSLNDGIWNDIWARQTEHDVFELYWIASRYDESSYRQSYREAEALLGARKAIRNFSQADPEPGYKCTLCGYREPLHASTKGSPSRDDLRDFWNRVRTRTGYRFREGEHLCAVCTTRRLAPGAGYVFGRPDDIPSTSSMSVADFLYTVVKNYQQDSSSLRQAVEEFVANAKGVASQKDLYFESEPLPLIADSLRNINTATTDPLRQLISMDGDWLFKETYTNIRRDQESDGQAKRRNQDERRVNPEDLRKAEKALDTLLNAMDKLTKPPMRPSKYYAVFAMDGDDMGTLIEGAGSENGHKDLSRSLADFARQTSLATIERKHLGKVIYFGGDEGVAFVSLDHLLPAIDACRKAFEKALGNRQATACVGAVIAHHQQALLQVLREVREALDHAKDLDAQVPQRKNAFCLSIMKRSGGTVRARAHWTDGDLDMIPLLADLIGYYKNDRLSDRWWRQLAEEEWGLKRLERGRVYLNRKLMAEEVLRLMTRHARKKGFAPGELSELVNRVRNLVDRVGDWDDVMGLMEAATYIARGGGR